MAALHSIEAADGAFDPQLADWEDHRMGQNKLSVAITPNNKDLLPIFRAMELNIKLVDPLNNEQGKIRRAKSFNPKELIDNLLIVIGAAVFIHGGPLTTYLRESPGFIGNLLK